MKKMKIQRKRLSAVIAVTLTLTIVATLSAFPAIDAQLTWTTNAFIACSPNPIGVNQTVWIGGWITPNMPRIGGVDYTYSGFTITIETPGGDTIIQPIQLEEAESSGWFHFVPDIIGSYYVWSSIPEQVVANDTYLAATSRKIELVVQEDPVLGWPAREEPTEFWTRPVAPENREWYKYTGMWMEQDYNASEVNFNPYTQGPNSAHVLWYRDVRAGGLVGGEYGSVSYYEGGAGAARTVFDEVIAGRGYYSYTDGVHCVDIKTGEEYWVRDDISYDFVQADSTGGDAFRPMLIDIGSTYLRKYDGLTGELRVDVEGMSGTRAWPYCYSYSDGHLIKWDLTGNTANFADRIVYNVSSPGSPNLFSGRYGVDINTYPQPSYGWNIETGELVWNRTMPEGDRSIGGGSLVAYEKYAGPIQGSKWVCYDMATGVTLWYTSPETSYPWGTFWAYQSAAAYGYFYGFSYGGIYCWNATTGQEVWRFQTEGSNFETPFNQYAFWTSGIVADGKVYAATSEHSISQPLPRGNSLYCVNAYTGDFIWKLLGSLSTRGGSCSDGVLLTGSEYDGRAYGISKGPTETTVTAAPKIVADGTPVIIEGTVIDLSPAQPGTPAIADYYMSQWMEYLHRQQPRPTDATGVPVTLDAINPEGEFIHIGDTTSSAGGVYSYMWTPPDEGKYTIIATFPGSESYYSSYAETAFGVTEASPGTPIPPTTEPPTTPPPTTEPPTTPPPTTEPPTTPPPTSEAPEAPLITTEVAIAISVAAAAVIGLGAFYWNLKRKQTK